MRKMAIDYRAEWKKLHNTYGGMNICVAGTLTQLSTIMNIQVQETISGREKLMEDYIKSKIATDIIGGDKEHHIVAITNASTGNVNTMHIHKADFNVWCKERKGGK